MLESNLQRRNDGICNLKFAEVLSHRVLGTYSNLLIKGETLKYKQVFQIFLNFQVFALVVPIQGLGTEAVI